jgi:hypothetical protein
LLHAHHVLVRQAVDLLGGDAGAHVRRQHVQHLGGQPAGQAHAFDVGSGLDLDAHWRTFGRRTAGQHVVPGIIPPAS